MTKCHREGNVKARLMTDDQWLVVSVWHHGTCWLIWPGNTQICSVITNQVGDLCHSWSWICGLLVPQRSSASSLRLHPGRKRAVHPAGSCETRPASGRGRTAGTLTVELCVSTWRKSFEETKSGNNYTGAWIFSRRQPAHDSERKHLRPARRLRVRESTTSVSVTVCVWNKLDLFYISSFNYLRTRLQAPAVLQMSPQDFVDL